MLNDADANEKAIQNADLMIRGCESSSQEGVLRCNRADLPTNCRTLIT